MGKIPLKFYWYSGIVAVVVYLLAVVIGGFIYPGYSHVSQDVSQLSSTNSPIRSFMNTFVVYNLLVSVFGLGLWQISKNRLSKVASAFIVLIGALGVLISFFPINTRDTAFTAVSYTHIGIVSMVSLLTVAMGFLFWRGFKNTEYQYLAVPSLAAGLLFLVSGPIAGVMVTCRYAGLLERIPIGIFLVWILVVASLLHKKHASRA